MIVCGKISPEMTSSFGPLMNSKKEGDTLFTLQDLSLHEVAVKDFVKWHVIAPTRIKQTVDCSETKETN